MLSSTWTKSVTATHIFDTKLM